MPDPAGGVLAARRAAQPRAGSGLVARAAVLLVLAGCAPLRGGAPAAEALVTPGMRGLHVAHFADHTARYRFELFAAGSDSVAVSTEVVREERVRGRGPDARLDLIYRYGAPYSTVDTLRVRLRDLMPVSETLALPNRTYRFEYAPREVRERVAPADSAPRDRVLPMQQAYFAFNQMEAVIRSLPLRPGYRAILPLFSEIDGRIEVDSVSVVEPPAGRDGSRSWFVRFADPAIVQIFEIDRGTRTIQGSDVVTRPGGRRMRYRLIP